MPVTQHSPHISGQYSTQIVANLLLDISLISNKQVKILVLLISELSEIFR